VPFPVESPGISSAGLGKKNRCKSPFSLINLQNLKVHYFAMPFTTLFPSFFLSDRKMLTPRQGKLFFFRPLWRGSPIEIPSLVSLSEPARIRLRLVVGPGKTFLYPDGPTENASLVRLCSIL